MSGGFAEWAGPCCVTCGLPALLHAADGCDDAEGEKKALFVDQLDAKGDAS